MGTHIVPPATHTAEDLHLLPLKTAAGTYCTLPEPGANALRMELMAANQFSVGVLLQADVAGLIGYFEVSTIPCVR